MITIICMGCRTVGSVNRVTAGLRCTCGSVDLDLYEPQDLGAVPFLAAMGVQANSGGTGWGKTMPDPLKGWNEYPGSMPGENPDYVGAPAHAMPCKNCDGSGRSLHEVCRACRGTGRRHPPTSETPAPQVARHPGQTKVPFVGRRRQGGRTSTDPLGSPEQHIRETTPGYSNQGRHNEPLPDGSFPRFPNVSPNVKTREDRDYSIAPEKPLQLDSAPCPECGSGHTQIVKDSKEDGWWHCPTCGPLANVDKNPSVDPFDHSTYPGRETGFSKASRKREQKTGRVLAMYAAVTTHNPGLTQREALSLVRRTVQKYGE